MLRRVVFTSGAVSVSLFLLSVVFKQKHLQGAEWVLVVSLLVMSLLFIPSLAMYLYSKGQK